MTHAGLSGFLKTKKADAVLKFWRQIDLTTMSSVHPLKTYIQHTVHQKLPIRLRTPSLYNSSQSDLEPYIFSRLSDNVHWDQSVGGNINLPESITFIVWNETIQVYSFSYRSHMGV